MMKRFFPILMVLAVLLSACGAAGAPAAPTMNPADVQNTAVAAAWTLVAQTEAAKPTETPLPPTEVPSPTPLPTFTALAEITPLVVPTIEILPTATTAAQTGNCSGPIDFAEAGPTKRLRIENDTKENITVSLNLWTPNLFGQCGVYAIRVAKNERVVVNIPSGSWYAGAYTPSPPLPNGVSFVLGPSASQDVLRLIVTKQSIKYVGP